MRHQSLIMAILIVLLPSTGCSLLLVQDLEVSAWTPGLEVAVASEIQGIKLTFNQDVNKSSVENAFSLKEDGVNLPGVFTWDGLTMVFVPYGGFFTQRNYTITLETTAKTLTNSNLLEVFTKSFTTGTGGHDRPRLVAKSPLPGAKVDLDQVAVALDFSLELDPQGWRKYVEISPSLFGYWSLAEGNNKLTFTALEAWVPGTKYTITIAKELPASNGMSLGYDESWNFVVGTDTYQPDLVKIETLSSLGEVMGPLSEVGTNHVAMGLALRVTFDEAIDVSSFLASINTQGGPSWIRDPGQEPLVFSSVVTLVPQEKPSWNSTWSLEISPGVVDVSGNLSTSYHDFDMKHDLSQDRPPRLLAIGIPSLPGEATVVEKDYQYYLESQVFPSLDLSNEIKGYPINTPVESWWELYFETAPNGSIDLLSLMDLLSIRSTNGALDVSIRAIRRPDSFDPVHLTSLVGSNRVMILTKVYNRAQSGIVTVEIAKGLADSFGNRNGEPLTLELLK